MSNPVPVPTNLDSGHFRRALAAFASGVTVISTQVEGVDHAMTASAFSSVSLDPMLVLVCVEHSARFYQAISGADTWGVSILDHTAQAASSWLATPGRPLPGQLDRVPHHRGPITGHALLDQSLATLECRTAARHPAGDHTIVVGEVLGIALAADGGPPPLVYFEGGYRSLAGAEGPSR